MLFTNNMLSNVLVCVVMVFCFAPSLIFLVSELMFLIPFSRRNKKIYKEKKYIKSIGGDVSKYKPSEPMPLIPWNAVAVYLAGWPVMILAFIINEVCNFYHLIDKETVDFRVYKWLIIVFETCSILCAFIALAAMIGYSAYAVSQNKKVAA